MNLLDSIDKSPYSLIFSEETEMSPYNGRRSYVADSQSLKSMSNKPHTVLNVKTTLVNGSYSSCDKCDSSSDVESEEKRPLVQSEVRHGVSPSRSNGFHSDNATNAPSTVYNLINSGTRTSTGLLQQGKNSNNCYNIEYIVPSNGSPESNESQHANVMYNKDVTAAATTTIQLPRGTNNWGPDSFSSNLSSGGTVNSYSEGQKILPTYFIKDYSDIFGNIANYETDDVAKLPITSEESKMFLIGLSSNNENEDEDLMENEDQGSSNSPFQSATEEMGGDGDHDPDKDPLLIRPPAKQNVFHQFIRSAKSSSRGKPRSSRKHSFKESSPCDSSSSTALIKEVDPGREECGDAMMVTSDNAKSRCSIGIFLAAVSCVFFATSALIVKISSLHPMELLAVRGMIQGILVSPIVISTGNSFVGPSGSRSLLLARAVLGAVALVMGFAAIHLIPLADAATVIFTSPVFVSIFACLCLAEVCSWFDVSMIALTLLGVLLVSKPSFSFLNTGTWTGIVGTICGLTAAMLTALAFIVLRQLKHVHYSVTVFWFSTVLAMFGAVLTVALDGFTLPHTWAEIMECIGIGFCGFMGQILLTKALQTENALPIAVTRTFDIVLAFFYQITLLHDTPDWYSYLGSVLVVSCVLLTAFRRWYKESSRNKYTRVHKIADDDPLDDSQQDLSSHQQEGNFS